MKQKYKIMLSRMQEKEKQKKERGKKKKIANELWILYILQCRDGSFYTGITKDLERRLQMHQQGKASRFTRARLPIKLIYQERCSGRTDALVRECRVKGLPKRKKLELIRS